MIVSDRQGSMMGLSNAHVQGIGLETTGARRPAGLDPKGTYGRGHGALAPRMLLGRAKVSSLLGLRTADRPASKLVLERDRDCRLTSDRNLDARLVAAEPQIHSSMKLGDIALACCPPALWALCCRPFATNTRARARPMTAAKKKTADAWPPGRGSTSVTTSQASRSAAAAQNSPPTALGKRIRPSEDLFGLNH